MTSLALIRAKAERAGRVAQAHRRTHEAARLITPNATTVDLHDAEQLLRSAADALNTLRRETITDELRVTT